METVLRAVAVYAFLLVLVRLSGRRSLAQLTAFDFVLLLIISEAAQQALLGEDFSLTSGFVVITTLVTCDIGLSLVQERSPRIARWLEGTPVVLVDQGKVLQDRLDQCRVDRSEILEAAREKHGLGTMDQIEYAILEKSSGITIIPLRQP